MKALVRNQLNFRRNQKTILTFLKSKISGETNAYFSLNSIFPTPSDLPSNNSDWAKKLSFNNIELPDMDDQIRRNAEQSYFKTVPRKNSEAIAAEISNLKKVFSNDKDSLAELELMMNAYRNTGFISVVDWRLNNWGTPDDIFSINPASFTEDTTSIEFTTAWFPPIEAVKLLANTFPSVRFELLYQLEGEDGWHKVEVFPLNPFGY